MTKERRDGPVGGRHCHGLAHVAKVQLTLVTDRQIMSSHSRRRTDQVLKDTAQRPHMFAPRIERLFCPLGSTQGRHLDISIRFPRFGIHRPPAASVSETAHAKKRKNTNV